MGVQGGLSGESQPFVDLHAELADAVLERVLARNPQYAASLSGEGRKKCRQDLRYHFLYLADALRAGSPRLFIEYVRWVKQLFISIDVDNRSFLTALQIMREVLLEREEREELTDGEDAAHLIRQAEDAFESLEVKQSSYIDLETPLGPLARGYLDALLKRQRERAMRLVLEAVERGVDIRDIYEKVFQLTQREIGRLWQENRVSVAQEHYCTAATQLVMSRLYPYIFRHEHHGLVFVGASVGEELHELGIRMITDFFELEGWDTHFLGSNMPADSLVETLVSERADVVGISVTITYHISNARKLIEAIRARPELERTKVLVGGYPFHLDSELWKKLGADGTASSAREAVATADRLIEERGNE
jgi:methanogenic corrinoid protein MtbC1